MESSQPGRTDDQPNKDGSQTLLGGALAPAHPNLHPFLCCNSGKTLLFTHLSTHTVRFRSADSFPKHQE